MAVSYPELARHPRSLAGVRYPHPALADTYQPGVTEPWVQQVVAALVVANNAHVVLESGGFLGVTSAWLAMALESMGGGTLHVCEIDRSRAKAIQDRLDYTTSETDRKTELIVHCDDVMQVIHSLPAEYLDFVWLDDDHQSAHVEREIQLLWPKMKLGGLIVGHDIDPPCNLQDVFTSFGGFSIHLPKLGPSGGIGILQKR